MRGSIYSKFGDAAVSGDHSTVKYEQHDYEYQTRETYLNIARRFLKVTVLKTLTDGGSSVILLHPKHPSVHSLQLSPTPRVQLHLDFEVPSTHP